MKFFYSNLLIVFFCCIIIIDQDAIFLFRRSFVGGVVVCGRLDGVESDDIHSIDDGFVQNAYIKHCGIVIWNFFCTKKNTNVQTCENKQNKCFISIYHILWTWFGIKMHIESMNGSSKSAAFYGQNPFSHLANVQKKPLSSPFIMGMRLCKTLDFDSVTLLCRTAWKCINQSLTIK